MGGFKSLVGLAILTFLIFPILSCEKYSDDKIMAYYLNGIPEVTGIAVTNEFGHILGEWGQPPYIYSNSLMQIRTPYPNPGSDSVNVWFGIPYGMYISAWVVRALGPGESIEILEGYAGAQTAVINGNPIATIKDSTYHEAGFSNLRWYCRDDHGQPVPSGFYRIFIQGGEFFAWADFLLVRDCDYLPPNMPFPECE